MRSKGLPHQLEQKYHSPFWMQMPGLVVWLIVYLNDRSCSSVIDRSCYKYDWSYLLVIYRMFPRLIVQVWYMINHTVVWTITIWMIDHVVVWSIAQVSQLAQFTFGLAQLAQLCEPVTGGCDEPLKHWVPRVCVHSTVFLDTVPDLPVIYLSSAPRQKPSSFPFRLLPCTCILSSLYLSGSM